jgi:Zn finger protein HypA/HybF involved in hydrogenase expression
MTMDRIYCPHCEGEVRTTITAAPGHSTQANVAGAGELVCMDLGKGCTHSSCPLSSVSGMVMAIRLARSGLAEDKFSTVRAHCEGCHNVVDLKVLDERFAYCDECGTTNRWVRLKADGGYIILTGVEVAS